MVKESFRNHTHMCPPGEQEHLPAANKSPRMDELQEISNTIIKLAKQPNQMDVIYLNECSVTGYRDIFERGVYVDIISYETFCLEWIRHNYNRKSKNGSNTPHRFYFHLKKIREPSHTITKACFQNEKRLFKEIGTNTEENDGEVSESFVGTNEVGTSIAVEKKKINKNVNENENCQKITALGLNMEGGFKQKRSNYRIECTIYDFDKDVYYDPKELSAEVEQLCNAVVHYKVGTRNEQMADTWEFKLQESKYAKQLYQKPGIQIKNTNLFCEVCKATTNLWLNLSDGYIGCGRKIYNLGGGCLNGNEGAALVHYYETGQRYPLVVKLGTITKDGKADVFSYAPDENESVIDPFIAEHLANLGINVMELKKTEATTLEKEIETNQNITFSQTLNKDIKPVCEPGKIGLVNLGNTCYMNVVLQLLLHVKEIGRKFLNNLYCLFVNLDSSMKSHNDLLLQFAKICFMFFKDSYIRWKRAYLKKKEVGTVTTVQAQAQTQTQVQSKGATTTTTTTETELNGETTELNGETTELNGETTELNGETPSATTLAIAASTEDCDSDIDDVYCVSINPEMFRNCVNMKSALFNNSRQQDCCEYLSFLLNQLMENEHIFLDRLEKGVCHNKRKFFDGSSNSSSGKKKCNINRQNDLYSSINNTDGGNTPVDDHSTEVGTLSENNVHGFSGEEVEGKVCCQQEFEQEREKEREQEREKEREQERDFEKTQERRVAKLRKEFLKSETDEIDVIESNENDNENERSMFSCFSFLTQQTVVSSSNHKSVSTCEQTILSVDVPGNWTILESDGMSLEGVKISLMDCLKKYIATEIVDEFLCPKEKIKTRAKKITKIKTFPPYLLIQIKRFYADISWTAKKINIPIDAPEMLDLEFMRAAEGADEPGEVMEEDFFVIHSDIFNNVDNVECGVHKNYVEYTKEEKDHVELVTEREQVKEENQNTHKEIHTEIHTEMHKEIDGKKEEEEEQKQEQEQLHTDVKNDEQKQEIIGIENYENKENYEKKNYENKKSKVEEEVVISNGQIQINGESDDGSTYMGLSDRKFQERKQTSKSAQTMDPSFTDNTCLDNTYFDNTYSDNTCLIKKSENSDKKKTEKGTNTTAPHISHADVVTDVLSKPLISRVTTQIRDPVLRENEGLIFALQEMNFPVSDIKKAIKLVKYKDLANCISYIVKDEPPVELECPSEGYQSEPLYEDIYEIVPLKENKYDEMYDDDVYIVPENNDSIDENVDNGIPHQHDITVDIDSNGNKKIDSGVSSGTFVDAATNTGIHKNTKDIGTCTGTCTGTGTANVIGATIGSNFGINDVSATGSLGSLGSLGGGITAAQEEVNAANEMTNTEKIEQIVNLGFSRDIATASLIIHKYNLSRAIEYILTDGYELTDEKCKAIMESRKIEDGPARYELIGSIVHIGKNANCGHYIAYMKDNDKWYICNDNKIGLCEKNLGKDDAYIHLYKRI